MGIFSSHTQKMNTSSSSHKGHEDETNSQTSSSSAHGSHTASHSNTSASKAACGCGSCHQAKRIEEDVVEVKEEWDY